MIYLRGENVIALTVAQHLYTTQSHPVSVTELVIILSSDPQYHPRIPNLACFKQTG